MSVGSATQVVPAAGLEFRVYQDNGGNYAWEVVHERGESLTRPAGFLEARCPICEATRNDLDDQHSFRPS
jgi:hypothetical protein